MSFARSVWRRAWKSANSACLWGPIPPRFRGNAQSACFPQHPRLFVELQLFNWTKIVNQVLKETIDLGFVDLSEAAEDPELETAPVRSSQLNFFCASGRPLAGRNSVKLEDLCEFPWVGPTVTDRMRRFLPEGDLSCGVFDAARADSCRES